MKILEFNNFHTVGWNNMKPSLYTPPHWGLSDGTKYATGGRMVREISLWQTKQTNKQNIVVLV